MEGIMFLVIRGYNITVQISVTIKVIMDQINDVYLRLKYNFVQAEWVQHLIKTDEWDWGITWTYFYHYHYSMRIDWYWLRLIFDDLVTVFWIWMNNGYDIKV